MNAFYGSCCPSVTEATTMITTITTTTTTTTTQYQDPLSNFPYGLKAPETRRHYPHRLKAFLDYLKLEGPLKHYLLTILPSSIHTKSCSSFILMRTEGLIE